MSQTSYFLSHFKSDCPLKCHKPYNIFSLFTLSRVDSVKSLLIRVKDFSLSFLCPAPKIISQLLKLYLVPPLQPIIEMAYPVFLFESPTIPQIQHDHRCDIDLRH